MKMNPVWWCGVVFAFLLLAVKPVPAAELESQEVLPAESLTNQPPTTPPTKEEPAPPPADPPVSAAEVRELFRAYLQLQQQLHDALLAIEQNRREAAETSIRTTESVTASLRQLQTTFTGQREQDLQFLQNNNRSVIALAGVFAGSALLALVVAAWLQMRAINRLATVATTPTPHLLPQGSSAALAIGDPAHLGETEPLGAGLRKAVETLEHRIRELEHTASTHHTGDQAHGHPTESSSRAALLIGKGQTLLNLNDAEAALHCFEEALGEEPSNPDIMIKKGTALEKLRRLEEAIQCYDRAIELNDSSTLAYLYKGGVYNQLERFNDAIQCYELALRSQQKAATATSSSA